MEEMPFQVGEEIESKSFVSGFRGAWFRSKIKKMRLITGCPSYLLKFFDYPDEKDKWTRAYQKFPHRDGKIEVMVRPSFPPFYRESHLPASFPACDVIAIIADNWQVGDLVEWWCTDCYWTGTITKLLGDSKVQLHLFEPPIGEGGYYEADYKDLRPMLNWSPENGWTVPVQKVYGDFRVRVRLIHPNNQGRGDFYSKLDSDGFSDKAENNLLSPLSEAVTDASIKQESVAEDVSGAGFGMPSRKDLPSSLDYLEEIWISERNYWNKIRRPCTLESSIIELEELSLKINWLKGVIKLGLGRSNATKPSWKFLVMDASLQQ